MGSFACVVIVCSDQPAEELTALVERSDGIEQREDLAQGWQIAVYGSEELEDIPELLAELLAETGRPVLIAEILDSDAAEITALSAGRGTVRAAVARKAMRGYCVEDGIDFDASFAAPDIAAGQLSAWATDAGLVPDTAALTADLTAEWGTRWSNRCSGASSATSASSIASRLRTRARPTSGDQTAGFVSAARVQVACQESHHSRMRNGEFSRG